MIGDQARCSIAGRTRLRGGCLQHCRDPSGETSVLCDGLQTRILAVLYTGTASRGDLCEATASRGKPGARDVQRTNSALRPSVELCCDMCGPETSAHRKLGSKVLKAF